MFNAAIATLNIYKSLLSSSLQTVCLRVAAEASFAPLFVVPSSKFWHRVSEFQMMPQNATDEDTSSNHPPPSQPSNTVTSLFVLSGIFIHRGLRRSYDYLQAYRHTSAAAAAAAEADDGIFRQQHLWCLAMDWCTSFGQILQQQNNNEIISELPSWMVEVCLIHVHYYYYCYSYHRHHRHQHHHHYHHHDYHPSLSIIIIHHHYSSSYTSSLSSLPIAAPLPLLQIVCFTIDIALSRPPSSCSYDLSPSSISSDAIHVRSTSSNLISITLYRQHVASS